MANTVLGQILNNNRRRYSLRYHFQSQSRNLNRYLNILTRTFGILAICIVMVLSIGASHSLGEEGCFSGKPDWLSGTLLFNTMGSEEVLPCEMRPILQYVCALDFDNKTLISNIVPSNSILLKDPGNGAARVVYRMNSCHGVDDSESSVRNWKNYGLQRVYVSQDGIECNPYIEEGDITGASFEYYPIAFVSLVTTKKEIFEPSLWNSVYKRSFICMTYGVSDEDHDLVLQVVKEEDSFGLNPSIKVLKEYTKDYPIGNLKFAISKEMCAIAETNGEIWAINFNDLSTYYCPDKSRWAICWLDDSRLLYSVRVFGDYPGYKVGLRIWDTMTGEVSDLSALWHGEEYLIPMQMMPLCMALNDNKTVLALYEWGSIDAQHFQEERGGRIIFINMNNGARYEITPWDIFPISQSEMRGIPYFWGYGITDNGQIIYDPKNMIDLRLVWYN